MSGASVLLTPLAHDLRLRVENGRIELQYIEGTAAHPLATTDVSAFPSPGAYLIDDYLTAPPEPGAVESMGTALADWLIPSTIRAALLSRLTETPPSAVLRLRLDCGAAGANETPQFPWELAFIPSLGFLALHPQIRFVREVRDARWEGAPPAPAPDAGKRGSALLRVLLVGANPATAQYPYLGQLAAEMEVVRLALEQSPECRKVRVRCLNQADPMRLREALREFRPHALHLICHGESRPSGHAFVLCNDDSDGGPALVYHEELAGWLALESPRLVVVTACGSPDVPRNLARLLNRSGATDVVAMQMALRDVTARQFSRAFYSTYAEAGQVEESVWQARQAVQGIGIDWAVATLHRSTARMEPATALPPTPPRRVKERPASPRPISPGERAFVGRVGPVADILGLFRRQGARLVTITGIGGMGKTTLARHCAHLLRTDHPGGVHWIDIVALGGREELLSAIRATLGLPVAGTPGAKGRAFPTRRRVLIVLDCFERHVADAGLLAELLETAPGLHLLVTSRAVLGLAQEYEYPLAPMILPERDAPPVAGSPLSESVALFADAAARVQHGFQVDEQRADVEEVCRLLEGVPLSLVLAAGRLRYLSARELLEQVRLRPLDVVKQPGKAGDRHAALLDVITDSLALLDAEDRELLGQLAVFSGGFYLDDAMTVCDLSATAGGDVFEGIGRLRENSLVQSAVRNGRTRFHLLDTVRECLTSGGIRKGDTALRRRHCDRYRARARQFHARMKANEWLGLAADLTADIGNLRTAITFAREEGDDEAVMEFADMLARILIQASLWSDFDALAEAAQKAHQRVQDPVRFIRLVAYRAMIARSRGQETEARILMERWLAFCRENQDAAGAADALLELASQARALGEMGRAMDLLTEAYAAADIAGDDGLAGRALAQRAELAAETGDHDAARRTAADADERLALCRKLEIRIFSRITLARVFRTLNDLARAERELRAALSVAVDGAETFAVSRALLELGPLYEEMGALPRAAMAYLAADRVHAHVDARRREDATLYLRRFRRSHGEDAAVRATLQAARAETWSALVARLLTETFVDETDDPSTTL